MDFFFSRTYKYTVDKPIDKVIQHFLKVTDKKWAFSSENIAGTFNDDKTFRFSHLWTLGYIRGFFGNDFATIKGIIKDDEKGTIIETTLRPNFGLVLFVYLLVGLFVCELLGITSICSESKTDILLLLPFFGLIIIGLILFMTNGLRNTFEKVFQLQDG